MYNAAAQVVRSIQVIRNSQSITGIHFTTTSLIAGSATTVNASASSGLAVTFTTATPTVCSVTGNTVTGISSGDCVIFADQIGNETTAPASRLNGTITIEKPFALAVSMLSDGAISTGTTLNVSGMITNIDKLKALTVNGITVPVNPDGSFSYPVQLFAGTTIITVTATDTSDVAITEARTITLSHAVPRLTVLSPPDNASVSSRKNITITGVIEGSDSSVTVNWSINDSSPHTATILNGNYSFSADLADGINTIQITAVNAAGQTTNLKRTINYNPPFSLAITNPMTDIRMIGDSFTLTGTVADNSTAVAITISMNGETYAPALVDGTFSQQLRFTGNKTYQVRITGIDENNNSLTVQRNIIHTNPMSTATLSIADALVALQISAGILPSDSGQIMRMDVAPMVNGVSVGDGLIDIEDAIIILRMAVGIL
jgi:hypothetical protein